jgi:hypothetical protein
MQQDLTEQLRHLGGALDGRSDLHGDSEVFRYDRRLARITCRIGDLACMACILFLASRVSLEILRHPLTADQRNSACRGHVVEPVVSGRQECFETDLP